MLEAVPNVSEGRDERVIAEIGKAFGSSAALLDVHSDADHHRSRSEERRVGKECRL